MRSEPRVLIVAGEASGDLHAASLLKELRQKIPSLQAFGVGGSGLRLQGMDVVVDCAQVNVIGAWDWIDKVREVFRSYFTLKRTVRERRPDLAILLDLPDFNLRLARFLKKQKVPVIYYISPQVWAWRRYRVRIIRDRVSRMLVVFPFEKKFYQDHGVEVSFVGHPLLDSIRPRLLNRTQSEVASGPRIAVLPGSRKSEIRFHLPIVREVLRRLKHQYPNAEVRVPIAPTVDAENLSSEFGERVRCETGNALDVLQWADVALVASGTATLETALVGTPFCLFYRVSATSAWLFQNIVRYQGFIGMPNVLAGREIVREFFQQRATPDRIFEELKRLIEDEAYRKEVGETLLSIRSSLGDTGASRRAATEILAFLKN